MSERRAAVEATAAESRRAVVTRSAPGNAPGAASTGSEAGTRSTGTVATEESAGSETAIERGTGGQSTGDVRGRFGVVGRFVNRGKSGLPGSVYEGSAPERINLATT